jgi:hypothetical protein
MKTCLIGQFAVYSVYKERGFRSQNANN